MLSASPTDLFITFDRPIDDFSLSNFDFTLVHVAADGSTTPLGISEASYSEALDPDDPTGSRIDLTLTSPCFLGVTAFSWTPTARSRVSTAPRWRATVRTRFCLHSQSAARRPSSHTPQTGLASAVDLGTIGSTETIHSDVLDLASDPGHVLYYKINVAPGHHWRLGVAITTEQTSNSLASALSLFDAEGKLIPTDNEGLPGDVNDPYLFAGLAPGTYYVGVSAQKNVPDASGPMTRVAWSLGRLRPVAHSRSISWPTMLISRHGCSESRSITPTRSQRTPRASRSSSPARSRLRDFRTRTILA